jgi:transcriptional regulator with XRE-family HTH domain
LPSVKFHFDTIILGGASMALLSERLKELRSEKKLTQQELANKVNVNRVTYTNWENGKREPELDKVVEIAKELDCTVDYLLGLSDINPFQLLQDPTELEKMSEEEILNIRDMLFQNIAFITAIAKAKFGHTDAEMKEILSNILDNYENSKNSDNKEN